MENKKVFDAKIRLFKESPRLKSKFWLLIKKSVQSKNNVRLDRK